jgi:uncharacterized membrane protein
MELLRRSALLAATLTTGLMAGLLMAYAVSVMPALSGADDRTAVDVMQRINVAILNGWFGIVFGGALVFGALAILTHLPAGGRAALPWIGVGVAGYVVTLAVTAVVNVPLNNALAAAGPPGQITDLAAVRAAFEPRWVTFNVVRTVSAVAGFASLLWALLLDGPA